MKQLCVVSRTGEKRFILLAPGKIFHDAMRASLDTTGEPLYTQHIVLPGKTAEQL
jgi:hypothetical protein